MDREGLGEREARQRIVTVEADRKAFLMKHFHADFADPTTFDLVVNTAVLGTGGACGAIRAAVAELQAPVAVGALGHERRERRDAAGTGRLACLDVEDPPPDAHPLSGA